MPKRRRYLLSTPQKNKLKGYVNEDYREYYSNDEEKDKDVYTARGRFKGALMDLVHEPAAEESDVSEPSPPKRSSKKRTPEKKHYSSDEEDILKSPPRQSYVLKLFDRSVDLSQFTENSPLYPICRAWMYNQPKANYDDFGKIPEDIEPDGNSIELPGPEGPVISRIPKLLPEQEARNKEKINLNYTEAPPPSKEALLQQHAARWSRVRGSWLQQAARVEGRYSASQRILNSINLAS